MVSGQPKMNTRRVPVTLSGDQTAQTQAATNEQDSITEEETDFPTVTVRDSSRIGGPSTVVPSIVFPSFLVPRPNPQATATAISDKGLSSSQPQRRHREPNEGLGGSNILNRIDAIVKAKNTKVVPFLTHL